MEKYSGPEDTPKKFNEIVLNQLIVPYIEKAKQTLQQTKSRFLQGLPKGYSLFVTIKLESNDGQKENAFVQVEHWNNYIILGKITTQLSLVEDLKFGQSITIQESDIIDWTISSPDGGEEGNFIGKFLDSYYRGDTDNLHINNDASVIVKYNYVNIFTPIKPMPSLVPCLTPGCSGSPFNTPLCLVDALLAYSKEKGNNEPYCSLECSTCGKTSTYISSILKMLYPPEYALRPLDCRQAWALLLVGITKSAEMDYDPFFGERLFIEEISINERRWEGTLVSKSQYSPNLAPGSRLSGPMVSGFPICDIVVHGDSTESIAVTNIQPQSGDIGIFVSPQNDSGRLFAANLFCRNPRCAHIFGITYQQLKNQLIHGNADATLYFGSSTRSQYVLTCNLCSTSRIVDLDSFSECYRM